MNYDFCDDMYVDGPPQASVSRSSAAQTVDGNSRVRAPGFRPGASPFLGATLRAQQILMKKCAIQLRFSGLIGTGSHRDLQEIRIIGFFFENRVHWQFEVRVCNIYRTYLRLNISTTPDLEF
jgi:hypothetical protein